MHMHQHGSSARPVGSLAICSTCVPQLIISNTLIEFIHSYIRMYVSRQLSQLGFHSAPSRLTSMSSANANVDPPVLVSTCTNDSKGAMQVLHLD